MSASEVTTEATAAHVNLRDSLSVLQVQVIASLELNRVHYAEGRKKSLRARYYFGILFLIMNFIAWFFRDYGQGVLPFIHHIKACGKEGEDCFHALGVLRFIILLVSMALPFFLPSELVQIYGEVARIGAGVFLLLQLVSVIQFIIWWNKYWIPDEERKQRSPSWSFSEPATARCQTKNQEKGNSDWITIIGFLIAIFAIVIAAFSTGIDSKSFQFSEDKVEEEDDIPYSYGFFHLVFSLGAMYFAMLFISWDLNNSARKWSIDVGWMSAWVRVINEWFAATIYIWMLISPIVRENKVMNNGRTVQETVDSVMP
ncbi:hypothetical protein LR48_Vigan02g055300 [Vigna angularis]|uniref:Serine incorporator n=1 Tax=Phaseolus angularis TaxID=3914 RepID=A0A0L9TUY4_PHAAN|nr:hypothetical protein LR48_Vigan02g055300 [Vigna angularis]